MGLIDESDAKENWTPYVIPMPRWMDEMGDGEHTVNGYRFTLSTGPYGYARMVVHHGYMWQRLINMEHSERSEVTPKPWGKVGRVMDDTEMLKVRRDAVEARAVNWRNGLDERQRKEVEWAEKYVGEFNHGTVGHNQLVVIAKLAGLLDEIEKVVSGG